MKTVFLETDFLLLLVSSLLAPLAIYLFLLKRRAVARATVLILACILIALSGIDVVLLKALAHLARTSLAPFDDRVFNSEISITLYILPVVFAGIGTNLISHVLIDHLVRAERMFDRQHPGAHD